MLFSSKQLKIRVVIKGSNTTTRSESIGLIVSLSEQAVSAAHCGALTLAVAGDSVVGCDVEESVVREASVWQALLGEERSVLVDLLVSEAQLSFDAAATRVWSAAESMRKSGVALGTPLLLDQVLPDGWVTLRAGALRIATCQLAVRGFGNPLVVALAIGAKG